MLTCSSDPDWWPMTGVWHERPGALRRRCESSGQGGCQSAYPWPGVPQRVWASMPAGVTYGRSDNRCRVTNVTGKRRIPERPNPNSKPSRRVPANTALPRSVGIIDHGWSGDLSPPRKIPGTIKNSAAGGLRSSAHACRWPKGLATDVGDFRGWPSSATQL